MRLVVGYINANVSRWNTSEVVRTTSTISSFQLSPSIINNSCCYIARWLPWNEGFRPESGFFQGVWNIRTVRRLVSSLPS